MTFLLCTNKVIFSSGFCPAARDVRSGREEEPLHPAPEGSNGEGEGPPRSGSVQRDALAWGLPGRRLKRRPSKCHGCLQPPPSRAVALGQRAKVPGGRGRARPQWAARAELCFAGKKQS